MTMRAQRTKDLYFAFTTPATAFNHLLWRTGIQRAPKRLRGSPLWLQLGSGTRPHPRFLNVEGNIQQKRDAWLDIRRGLPFRSGSVDLVYSCHVFEHFYAEELRGILAESHRVLRPGGAIRMLVPSLEMAVEAYLKGDRAFLDIDHNPFGSLGGAFTSFVLLDGQHKLAIDRSLGEELLKDAGFIDVRSLAPRKSETLPQDVLDQAEPPLGYIEKSLVLEARKG